MHTEADGFKELSIAVIGNEGSGKSTLIRALCELLNLETFLDYSFHFLFSHIKLEQERIYPLTEIQKHNATILKNYNGNGILEFYVYTIEKTSLKPFVKLRFAEIELKVLPKTWDGDESLHEQLATQEDGVFFKEADVRLWCLDSREKGFFNSYTYYKNMINRPYIKIISKLDRLIEKPLEIINQDISTIKKYSDYSMKMYVKFWSEIKNSRNLDKWNIPNYFYDLRLNEMGHMIKENKEQLVNAFELSNKLVAPNRKESRFAALCNPSRSFLLFSKEYCHYGYDIFFLFLSILRVCKVPFKVNKIKK